MLPLLFSYLVRMWTEKLEMKEHCNKESSLREETESKRETDRILGYCEGVIVPGFLRHVEDLGDHFPDPGRELAGDVNAFLSELSLAVLRVLVRSVLHHLHPLPLLALLRAVLGYHVQLTNFVLELDFKFRNIFGKQLGWAGVLPLLLLVAYISCIL